MSTIGKVCNVRLILKNETILYLQDNLYSDKNVEIAGDFNVEEVFEKDEVYDKVYNLLPGNQRKIGTDEKVAKIESKLNWHTHPKQSYIKYNVKRGIPSNWDYALFLKNYTDKNINTIFHIVVSLEGLYIISMNKSFLNVTELDDNLREHIMDHFGMIPDDSFRIKNYINEVNDIKYNNKNIFNVVFKYYNDKNFTFDINYISDENNGCDLK